MLEKCRGERYLEMAPFDSPSKTALETDLLGYLTLQYVPYLICQLNQLTVSVTDIYGLREKVGRSRIDVIFDEKTHGNIRFCEGA